MDVVENQHYITKWVEDNIINKVKDTILERNITEGEVDDIIQDGVKETSSNVMMFQSMKVEDTIQNGVKYTSVLTHIDLCELEDAIQNGVRHTEIGWHQCNNIDDAIEKGVKETMFNQGHKQLTVKNIIENGVRHTLNTEYMPTSMVEDIIENGVKETKTPGKDGDILSTIEWMKENKSTSYTKMIDDVIDNGEKINGTYVGGNRQKENIESVIGYGTKNPSV